MKTYTFKYDIYYVSTGSGCLSVPLGIKEVTTTRKEITPVDIYEVLKDDYQMYSFTHNMKPTIDKHPFDHADKNRQYALHIGFQEYIVVNNIRRM